jgi:hypothetical protein
MNSLEVGYRRVGKVDIEAFKLDKETTITIEGTGGMLDRMGNDLLFYGWILDGKTREVVWSLLEEEDDQFYRYRNKGHFDFETKLTLVAGDYEVYYAAGLDSDNTNFEFNLSDIADWIFSGDDRRNRENSKRYSKYSMTISTKGDDLIEKDIYENVDLFSEDAFISVVRAGDDEFIRENFTVEKDVEFQIYGVGEQYDREQFDFAWIVNSKTYEKVWPTKYTRYKKAGGGKKNKIVSESIELPKGDYTFYYVTDDSHSFDNWNVLPPYDPQSWGVSIWTDNKDVKKVKLKGEVDHFALRLTKARDDDYLSQAFKIEQDMDVRIYSIGERSGRYEMSDYGWIVDLESHEKIWEFRERNSEYAGGDNKNRMINEEIHLEKGNYMAYYVTDGSHSYRAWNAAPPLTPDLYGLSILAENPEHFKLKDARDMQNNNILAQIVRVRNNAYDRENFSLRDDSKVRVYAIGEGDSDDMFDFGWIKNNETGKIVWEMTARNTDLAGGARKNKLFDGIIYLPAGEYTLYYESDGSHSFRNWNASAPHDQENYGISVYMVKKD